MHYSMVLIEGDEAELVKAGAGGRVSVGAAIRSGSVVFLPSRGSSAAASYYTYLAKHGLKPRVRSGERDGVAGVYIWAVER